MRQSEFDHIFTTYHAALCVYATKLVRDSHVAEDLVEEVFMKVLQRSPLKSRVEDWRPFLYISVRNTCFKYLKKAQAFVPMEAELLQIKDELDHEQVYVEIYQQVLAAIGQLPDKCGKVIRMSFLEQKSTAEIAEALHITESTVYNQKARGIALLKKMLSGVAFYSFLHLH